MGKLAGKNVLITGGNSGIGLAAAQEFDREGARVAICGLNAGSLQAAKETLGAGSLAVRADVSNLKDLDDSTSAEPARCGAGHSAGDHSSLGSCGFHGVLALEITETGRATKDRSRVARYSSDG